MADIYIYSFGTAWVCCCIPLMQNQSMIIVKSHMYLKARRVDAMVSLKVLLGRLCHGCT